MRLKGAFITLGLIAVGFVAITIFHFDVEIERLVARMGSQGPGEDRRCQDVKLNMPTLVAPENRRARIMAWVVDGANVKLDICNQPNSSSEVIDAIDHTMFDTEVRQHAAIIRIPVIRGASYRFMTDDPDKVVLSLIYEGLLDTSRSVDMQRAN
jgi:hypothetical protein